MRYLLLINAGGTITSKSNDQGVLEGAGHSLLAGVNLDSLPLAVREKTVYRGLSEDLSLNQASAIAGAALDAVHQDDVAGVVVTHGTDTLEETAFLCDLWHDCSKPVVFTGAQRAPEHAGYDGHRNLLDALHLAAMPDAAAHGVTVVFAGEILAARYAIKANSAALTAFTAREPKGRLGRITDRGIALGRPLPRHTPWQRQLPAPDVLILPIYLGATAELLKLAMTMRPSGLVLQTLGSGNVPASIAELIEAHGESDVVFASASHCAGGVSPTYQSGARLAEAGVIGGGDLDARKLRLLLACALAEQRDPEQLKSRLEAYLLSTEKYY